MKPKFFIAIIFFLLYHNLHAQSSQKSINKSLLTLTIGLNTNDAYDFEFSYHYMLSHYLGIGGGIGYFRQWYNEYLPIGAAHEEWDSWVLSESDRKVGKVYFHPSIHLFSPTLFKIRKYDFLFTGELGTQILIPYSGLYIEYINSNTNDSKLKYISTNKGDYFFWSAKGGVTLRAYNSALTIGYGISNLDIYSSRRNLNIEKKSFSEFYPPKKMTHSLFLSLNYFF